MRKLSLVGLAILVITGQLFAQGTHSLGERNYWGFEAGLNYSGYMGSDNFYFIGTYPHRDLDVPIYMLPRFDNLGNGLGFQIGGTFDVNLTHNLAFVGKLMFRQHHSSSDEEFDFTCYDSSATIPGNATLGQHFEATYNYLGVDFLLRYQFSADSWYGLLGLGFGSMLSNRATLSEKIIRSDNDCQFLTLPLRSGRGGTVAYATNDQDQGDYFNGVYIGPKIGIGTFIPLGDNGMVLTPELSFSLPLTDWLSKSEQDAYDQVVADYPSDPNSYFITESFTPYKPDFPKMWYASLTFGLKFPWGSNSAKQSNRSDLPPAQLAGSIRDKQTNESIRGAEVTIMDLATNEVVKEMTTGGSGHYEVELAAPGRYSMTADAGGYLFNSTYIEIDEAGRIIKGTRDIYLDKSISKIRLLVFFDFDKASLKQESYPELQRAVRLMKNNPRMEVEIAGHTDNVGAPEYNKDLSARRAGTVMDYLAQNGIDTSRLTAVGYGELQPVDTNDTDEGRANNRRVEFVVKKK